MTYVSRRLALWALVALLIVTTPLNLRAQETSATIRLAVGATQVIELIETPGTGYRWRLTEAMSRDLALVSVTDLGFTPRPADRSLIGAPGMRRFRIAARGPGTALAVFDYARPWERVPPARRHSVTIEIGRQ